MALDGLRARLDQMLADLARTTDAASSAPGLFDALVEIKAALAGLRDALGATERELAHERQQLDDAERRGRLAAEISDQETVDLAGIWVGKHRERVELLERKRVVQLDELAYAERQQAETTEAYRKAKLGLPQTGAPAAAAEAEGPDARAAQELDYRARQALVQEQLAHLKKKLGRQD
jgi:hypothetical protein